MAVVRVVQVAGHDVVAVVSVRNRLVSAVLAVDVAFGVARAAVRRRASSRILRPDLERALVDVTVVGMMQVAIMKVVDVTFVLNGRVAASAPVVVIVVGVSVVRHGVIEISCPEPLR